MIERINPLASAFTTSPKWSREQTLLAFKFYCENPFGQLHGRNKKIIELAGLIGRSPSALAMKCVNFASLDPKIRESGRTGLSNVSALDRDVWKEFHANWDELLEECETLQVYLRDERVAPVSSVADTDPVNAPDYYGETRVVMVAQRVKQDFFRRAVLSGYGYKCCISGVSDERLLIASHIVRWSDDPSIRLHPGNGLCLSAIHDKAFDSCLFSLSDDYRVILSRQLRATKDKFLQDVFLHLEDSTIALPNKFAPECDFIARHRSRMDTEDAAVSLA